MSEQRKDALPDPIGGFSDRLGEAGKKFFSSLSYKQLSELSISLDSFMLDIMNEMVITDEPKTHIGLKGGFDALARVKDVVRQTANEKLEEAEQKAAATQGEDNEQVRDHISSRRSITSYKLPISNQGGDRAGGSPD
jgi:hypothetical protein